MTVNYIYWTVRPEIFTAGPFTVGTAGMWIFAAICALIIILDRVALSKAMARWKADGKPAGGKPENSWANALVFGALALWTVSQIPSHPHGISIGPISLRWYGMMFLTGFTAGYWIVSRMFRHEGACQSWMPSLLIWVAAGTIIGARLGHCFFYEWDYYSAHPEKIIAFWEGGLASHGGTIGVILCVIGFNRYTAHKPPLWTFDRLVPAIALVGCLIRLGNLFNSEIFGHATTLPWGFMFPLSREWQQLYAPDTACHPTQIYEAACYLALFFLLMWMYWKRNAQQRPGLILGVFFIGIFLPRIIIEFVKNNQEAFEDTMLLNMGQLLSVPFMLAGIYLVYRAMTRPKEHLTFPDRYADEPSSGKH